MSKPTLEAKAGIYLLRWGDKSPDDPDPKVLIRLDHLREARSSVLAEITVKSSIPGTASHLHQAHIDLLSTNARVTASKYLDDRAPGFDWKGIIEQACVMVLEKHREGEPVYQMGTLPPRETLAYRVKPVLVEKQANLLWGPGGTGKSFFCAYIACLMDGVAHHNGMEVEPGPVLYLDYETDEYEIDARVAMIRRGLKLESKPDIHYRYCARPLIQEMEEIQRIILEKRIELVIIDSFGSACEGNQNEQEPVTTYYRGLRGLRCTTLTVDHTNKEGKLNGSEYKFHMARNVWEARKVQETGQDFIEFGLFHRKMNNGRLANPLGFKVTFTDKAATFEGKNVTDVPELAEGLSYFQQVFALLKTKPMYIKDIAETLNAKEEAVKKAISRHYESFVPLSKNSSGEKLWALKSKRLEEGYGTADGTVAGTGGLYSPPLSRPDPRDVSRDMSLPF